VPRDSGRSPRPGRINTAQAQAREGPAARGVVSTRARSGRARAAVRDNLPPATGQRGEHAMVEHQVMVGRGVIAASFSSSSMGSNRRFEVPPRQGGGDVARAVDLLETAAGAGGNLRVPAGALPARGRGRDAYTGR
jgi:hypothetical protein